MARKDQIADLLEVKGRSSIDWNAVVPPLTEMHQALIAQWESAKEPDERRSAEMLAQMLPVRLVALMQNIYKEEFARLIDGSDDCLEHCSSFDHVRFRIEYLRHIRREKLTIGEFVAHHLQVGSFEEILSYSSKLLGDDFAAALRKIEIKPKDRSFGLLDGELWDQVAERVTELFRVRHMIAHEVSVPESFTPIRAYDYLKAASFLIFASRAVYKEKLKAA